MKKKLVVEIILCVFTLSLIIYWLYNKLFKNRVMITLSKENIYKYQEYFTLGYYISVFMLILSIVLAGLIYYYKNKTNKVNSANIFYNIITKISLGFDHVNIFYKTYVIIFNSIKDEHMQYFIDFAKFVLSFVRITSYIIIFMFVVLPRLIILIVFLTEIYLGTLYYYFYSLLLTLIPLIFNLILFMLKDLGPRMLPELKKYVFQRKINYDEAIDVETPTGMKKRVTINFYLAPGCEALNLDEVMEDLYKPCLFIEPHITVNIKPRVFIISTITRIIYYSITAVGFIYILNV